MALENYFDFADNDYRYFIESYENGLIANMMGAMAQGICEKYMKHLICEYSHPENAAGNEQRALALRTHSLNRLLKYLKNNMNIEFSAETKVEMQMIDGFYFSTRYPGEDSIELDNEDLEHCALAVQKCREETLNIIKKFSSK